MDEPHFIFTSDKLELKNEGENFFVEGYISTSDLDLVNDIVTKDCLMDMADQMRQRVIKFDVEHESFRGKSNLEKEINKTTIPIAKVDDFLVDKKGLKVRAVLNRHSPRFDEVKGSIEDGFLDAFSIAYVPTKSTTQNKEGINVRMLDRLNLLNVAFTGNPINTESRMTNVFAKSLDFLDEQEKAKAPKRPKPKVPESEYEDDEEEEKEGPGGHKPDKTGPHGRGSGPGEGRADGSGVNKKKGKRTKEDLRKYNENMGKVRAGINPFEKKDNNHRSDIIKLQEAKMSEDNEKETQPEGEEEKPEESEQVESEQVESEQKDESEEEPEESEITEVKSRLEKTEKELSELKAQLKIPIRKSPIEQQDKSKQFESKSLNPLDVIQ